MCRVLSPAHWAQPRPLHAQKSKPRNGAREIFATAAAERTRVYVSAANFVAYGGRKATQSRDEIDLQTCINTTAISDTYCWLGREESNLRMAESKSACRNGSKINRDIRRVISRKSNSYVDTYGPTACNQLFMAAGLRDLSRPSANLIRTLFTPGSAAARGPVKAVRCSGLMAVGCAGPTPLSKKSPPRRKLDRRTSLASLYLPQLPTRGHHIVSRAPHSYSRQRRHAAQRDGQRISRPCRPSLPKLLAVR